MSQQIPNRSENRRLLSITHKTQIHQQLGNTFNSARLTRPQRRTASIPFTMTALTNLIKFYLSLPVVMISSSLLGYVSPVSSLQFWTRAITCYCSLMLCASYGVISSIILRIIGRPTLAQWTVARAYAKITNPLIGWEWEIHGKEHLDNRPAVFISNHQSELDVLMLGNLFPKHCAVTAKKILKYTPVLGWFMALSGTVFIDRANRQSALKTFDNAVKQMKKNKQSVWIFPEGTRSYADSPILLPFKKGAFHFAVQAGVPIVPIVVANYERLFSPKKRRFESGKIKVQVLDPIPTTDLSASDVDRIAIETRDRMLSVLESISPGTNPRPVNGSAGVKKEL